MSIVERIAQKSGLRFRAAPRAAIYRLRSLGMSEEPFAAYTISEPVRLMAHDLEPENDEMKREDLEKLAKPVAPDFQSFLKTFVAGAPGRELFYPPRDWRKT